MSRAIEIKSIDDLKAILESNPNFTLENLKEEIPDLSKEWSFDDRLSIPILRKIMNKYPQLDMDDLKEMYLNPDFFDEEYQVKDDNATVQKYISLIEYWKYVNTGFPFLESKKKK